MASGKPRPTALAEAALQSFSECSFTARKLRFLEILRLASPSLVTVVYGRHSSVTAQLSGGAS